MITRILRVGFNDIRLTWKDKTSLIWMLVMPIAFILFFGSMGSGGSGGPSNVTINLTVVDNDVSWLSRALIEALEGADFSVVESEPEDVTAKENRIRTLVIPEGFADAVARKEQVTLFLVRDSDANIQATAVAEVHIFRALLQLIGTVVEMQDLASENEPINLQVDRLAEYRELAARESLVRLETMYAGAGRAVPQGFGQAIPGMMTQFIIMIVMIVGAVYLTTEKSTGVLRRLAVSGLTPRTLIAGKLSGLVMLALLQAALLVTAATAIGRLGILGAEFYWGESPLALALLIFCFAVAAGGITLFLGAILSTPAQASGVGWLAGMIMAGLGGCWWPLEIVPQWLQTVGHIFPTAWMMGGLHELVSFGKGLEAVLPEMGVLLAYGGVFAFLGSRYLKVEG